MKKLYISAITFLTVLLLPATALAAFAKTSVTSGPSGPSSNGWFQAVATVSIQSDPACPTGAGTGLPLYASSAPQGIEGVHHIRIFSTNSSNPHDIIYDTVNGTTYTNELWRCAAISLPDQTIIEEYIFDQNISYDFNNPTISISSPGNNTNIDKATILVTGSVSDSGSGVRSVVIKGVNASISGNSFSANVPLNNGLNTVTAVATDNAGRTAQSQIVVNRINNCGGTCSASGATSSPNSTGSSSPQPAASNAAPQAASEADKAVEDKNDSPTLVKGVVQGGSIGLATVLAFIVVLLLLDRFRIIEIKAFSKITDMFSKNKTTKKPSKKSS